MLSTTLKIADYNIKLRRFFSFYKKNPKEVPSIADIINSPEGEMKAPSMYAYLVVKFGFEWLDADNRSLTQKIASDEGLDRTMVEEKCSDLIGAISVYETNENMFNEYHVFINVVSAFNNSYVDFVDHFKPTVGEIYLAKVFMDMFDPRVWKTEAITYTAIAAINDGFLALPNRLAEIQSIIYELVPDDLKKDIIAAKQLFARYQYNNKITSDELKSEISKVQFDRMLDIDLYTNLNIELAETQLTSMSGQKELI